MWQDFFHWFGKMSEPYPTLTTHAESAFDPVLYISLFYGGNFHSETEKNIGTWLQDQSHDIFKDGTLKGEKLLDIGTGPAVYPVITASKWFDEIYLSDISKANVEFLQKWRHGESEPMKYLMEYFARKEYVSWEQKNNEVLKKIKDVLELDVTKASSLKDRVLGNVLFDVVTSFLCLCTAVPLNLEDFKSVLLNIRKLLKPGGHLVVGDVIDESYYSVGDLRFKTLSTTPQEIQRAYVESGYVIEKWDTLSLYTDTTTCDASTLYVIVAKKTEDTTGATNTE